MFKKKKKRKKENPTQRYSVREKKMPVGYQTQSYIPSKMIQ